VPVFPCGIDIIDGGAQFSVGDRGAVSIGASRHCFVFDGGLFNEAPSHGATFVSVTPVGVVELDHCELAQGLLFAAGGAAFASGATVGNIVPGPTLMPS
jgi:hypothetical protein